MLIFTKFGDTPDSIAERVRGYPDSALAKAIRDANLGSSAWELMNGDGEYAQNRVVWVPQTEEPIDAVRRDDIVRRFDYIVSSDRYKLRKAQEQGIDVYTLLGVYALTAKVNDFMADSDLGLMGGVFAYKSLDRIFDLKLHRLDKFEESLTNIKQAIRDLDKAEAAEQAAALETYNHYNAILQQDFAYELKEFKRNHRSFYQRPMDDTFSMNQRGWEIYDSYRVTDVERMASVLRWGGRACWIIDAGMGGYEVFEAYRDHKDWTKVLKKEIEKTLITATTIALTDGVLAMLALTPVGWVAIVAVGIAEAGEAMYIEHKLNLA